MEKAQLIDNGLSEVHACVVRLTVLQSLWCQPPRFIHTGIVKESKMSYQDKISIRTYVKKIGDTNLYRQSS